MVSSFISWGLPVETCVFVTNSSSARKKPRYVFASFRVYQSEWCCNRKANGAIFRSNHGLILNNFLGGNSISILQCSHETDDVKYAIFDALKSAATRTSFLNVKVCFGSETGVILWSWRKTVSVPKNMKQLVHKVNWCSCQVLHGIRPV